MWVLRIKTESHGRIVNGLNLQTISLWPQYYINFKDDITDSYKVNGLTQQKYVLFHTLKVRSSSLVWHGSYQGVTVPHPPGGHVCPLAHDVVTWDHSLLLPSQHPIYSVTLSPIADTSAPSCLDFGDLVGLHCAALSYTTGPRLCNIHLGYEKIKRKVRKSIKKVKSLNSKV